MVAVMLMVLLTLIALALLSLSSVTLRTSTQAEAASIARANARFALTRAIAELQLHAGPDQRITANAAILDSNPDTESPDGVGEPLLTGVWDAHSQAPGQQPSIPSYDKSSPFRRWLVSGLSESDASNPKSLSQPVFRQSKQGVCLASDPASTSSNTNSSNVIWAGKVNLPLPPNARGFSGNFAYAVIDEGVKARVDFSPASTTDAEERARSAAGAPSRNGIAAVRGTSTTSATRLDAYHGVRDQLYRAPSLASAELIKSGLPSLEPFANDLTTESLGVVCDVTQGGLRKDLSLFGELSSLPNDYASRRIYSDSDSPLSPDNSASSYNAGSADPWWSWVHDLLNFRKKLGSAGTSGLPGLTTNSVPSGFAGGTGEGSAFRTNRGAQAKSPLAPVILRAEVMYSFFAKDTKGHNPWEWDVPNAFGGGEEGKKWSQMLHLLYTPMVTLWNPYNVPLTLQNPVVEITNPPAAFRFIRQKSTGTNAVGEITNRLVPVDEMYLYDWSKFDKKFVMQLYGKVDSAGNTSGNVTLLPGEVKLFSPAIPPTWNFFNVFDWQSDMTERNGGIPQIKAAPGWRGPQYGFNLDWVAGNESYINAPRNGPSRTIGVIASRLDDVWDVECGLALPKAKGGSTPIRRYTVSLLTSAGATGTKPDNLLSRIEFDYEANLAQLTSSLTPTQASSTFKIPFKMSSYSNPEVASNIRVGFNDPINKWIVKPILVLSAQAKSTNTADSLFPSRCWIHNDATKPISYQSLKSDHQAWNSHELALVQYKNGMATDAKVDANQRSFAFGGTSPITGGSSFFIQRELPLTPVQSVAALTNFDLAASGYPGADQTVGSSFAHPLVAVNQFATQISGQNAFALDHAWLANQRLWDSWYASTFTSLTTASWTRNAGLQEVTDGFFRQTQPLPNPRFELWNAGRTERDIRELLAKSASEAQPEGFKKAAAVQLLRGAFNINSTSKAAWMAVLGGLDRETLACLLFNGGAFSLGKTGLTTAGPYLSRLRMPARDQSNAFGANSQRFGFWTAGCELTADELDALAAGIVREVKLRGPFLSLAEFVNRRLESNSDFSTKGAIQAAIDNAPGIGDLNAKAANADRNAVFNELNRVITDAELNSVPSSNATAALGNTASGAPGALDQSAVLTQIGATISARSDTFRIRAYGDATDALGRVVASAWCDAVVQRVPDFVKPKSVGGNEAWDAPASSLAKTNQTFGRQFQIHSFRWLHSKEH